MTAQELMTTIDEQARHLGIDATFYEREGSAVQRDRGARRRVARRRRHRGRLDPGRPPLRRLARPASRPRRPLARDGRPVSLREAPVRILVIGGTGPTGLPIVQGLVEHGHDVTILHRGLHEHPQTPPQVTHLHADPYDEASLAPALEGGTWDVVVAMYGRLRRIAALTAGKCGHFVSVGGVPAYRGWTDPWQYDPAGLPDPARRRRRTRGRSRHRLQGLPDRAHRGGGVRRPSAGRALPLPLPLRPAPAGAPRVARRAPDHRRPRSHDRRRRRAHAAPPGLHRKRRSSSAPGHRASRTLRRAPSSTSATRRCSRSAR